MSDTIIERHKQTAYERWEMAPLTDVRAGRGVLEKGNSTVEVLAQELEGARKTGHQQGHQEGLTQGQAAGMKQGLAEGQTLITTQLTALQALMESLDEQLKYARENIAQHVLSVALDMAHAMMKSALEIEPQRVLPLIEQTLQNLPGLESSALLYLHPQDLELLAAAQGEVLTTEGWHLRADPKMMRGGCRVETPANAVDATLPTRWVRLQQALGQQGEWLRPL